MNERWVVGAALETFGLGLAIGSSAYGTSSSQC